MKFLKIFFNYDKIVVGLSGIRKQQDYVKITIPDSYKKTRISNFEQNYLLI